MREDTRGEWIGRTDDERRAKKTLETLGMRSSRGMKRAAPGATDASDEPPLPHPLHPLSDPAPIMLPRFLLILLSSLILPSTPSASDYRSVAPTATAARALRPRRQPSFRIRVLRFSLPRSVSTLRLRFSFYLSPFLLLSRS